MSALSPFYLPCKIYKVTGHDLYGEQALGAAIDDKCGIVRLRKKSMHTTVRADSSASRGHGDEQQADIIILLPPTTRAAVDDKLTVSFMSIRIRDMQPRYTVFGILDHYEVRGEIWE